MKFSCPTAAALLVMGTCFSSCDELADVTTLGHKFFQTDVLIVNDTESTLIAELFIDETAHVDACNPQSKRDEAKVLANETAELSATLRCQYGPLAKIQLRSTEVVQGRKNAFIQLRGTYKLEDLVIRDDMGILEDLVRIEEWGNSRLIWEDSDSIKFADWSKQTIYLTNHDLPSGPVTNIEIVADIRGSLQINDLAPGENLEMTVSDIPVIDIQRSWRFDEKSRAKKFRFVCDQNECRDL
jgi:hypothetical protein